ncbi:hypothetical protein E3J62_12570 [candidate division TA06 bacterium]|uniref:Alpha/beta hydrolase n=1 Tax=candidate division TA06 bacterium TaxID=2250710 RepID=A0A523UMC5_UNCT6|nr:MAG: hypothetical protein E3J62_12570 [candidate division TA06 bacterium]
MAKRSLLILHGWSGTSQSLRPLSSFLKKHGFAVVDIWLADYLSMNDEITIQDLGQAMGSALKDKKIPERRHSFDVIVHSTGGPVVRQYLIHYFLGKPEKCPIRHLVMLAPANFGSALAHIGKSMIGRLRLGWKWDHFLQTGTKVLEALELASPASWAMAEQDLFNPANRIFKQEHVYTTILIGTDVYPGLAGSFHKNGSDGTVYVSTANLNAAYIKVVFKTPKGYDVQKQNRYYDPIAFGVLYNRNHRTIVEPGKDKTLADLLIKSLKIKSADEYKTHIKHLNEVSGETFGKGLKDPERKERYHQYQHAVIRVHDQFGEGIRDYFVEFFQKKGDRADTVMQKVQKDILEKVRKYSRDASYRSFLFDITDLQKEILKKDKRVDMSLCAAALSKRIRYHDPEDSLTVASQRNKTLLAPNTTLLVDIELPRIQDERIFRFKKA